MLKLYIPLVSLRAVSIERRRKEAAVRANSFWDFASMRMISFCSFVGSSYHKQFE